jgi:hypothetical protein
VKRLVFTDLQGRRTVTPPGTVVRLKYPGHGGGGPMFAVSELSKIQLVDNDPESDGES